MTQRGKKRGAAWGFKSFGAYQHKGGDGRKGKGEITIITGLVITPCFS
jgi:hypothetical protein